MERLEILRATKPIVGFLVFVLFTGVLAFSLANSALAGSVVIGTTGQIQLATGVTAASGYWRDIQAAIDWVAANSGIGDVYIPEGTFNFVNVGESWRGARVVIPAGVNLFGAPTERTSGLPYDGMGQNPNDQVVEWKTILQIPSEAAPPRIDLNTMFRFQGSGDPAKPSRVSDIKFVGYREFEPTSDRFYSAIQMWNIIDFRVDHCFFKHMTYQTVNVRSPANGYCCGVIDHCKFINDYGYVEWDYAQCSVGYGVCIRSIGTTRWDDDITNVIGKYLSYTTFIEDCYFSRWRHCVCSNDGLHYVFRHNTIEKDSDVGSLDGHGTYDYVGTRAMEHYNNIIIDPVDNRGPANWDSTTPHNGADGTVVQWRGGGGVFFNNYIRNYKYGVHMTDEGEVQKCYPHDIWIWNNTWVNVANPTLVSYQGHYRITNDVDYFLYAPSWYTPYPYPHPLTLEKL